MKSKNGFTLIGLLAQFIMKRFFVLAFSYTGTDSAAIDYIKNNVLFYGLKPIDVYKTGKYIAAETESKIFYFAFLLVIFVYIFYNF